VLGAGFSRKERKGCSRKDRKVYVAFAVFAWFFLGVLCVKLFTAHN